jgi:hypothetical protein
MSATDNVFGLYPQMIEGERDLAAFDERATVASPLGGRQEPHEFLTETRRWLERHHARSVPQHTTVTPGRVIQEVNLILDLGDSKTELPVMLVADVAGDRIRDLRVYHSTWPLTGTHTVRHPLLQYGLTERPPEPVGTYHEALSAGDAAAADGVFEPDGFVREPAGGRWCYAGEDRTAWYRAILSQGPIVLHLGTISDDGTTVVYEYMADRWGAEPMTPQAGAAAYERGPSGKLHAARIYDDIEPPSSLGSW